MKRCSRERGPRWNQKSWSAQAPRSRTSKALFWPQRMWTGRTAEATGGMMEKSISSNTKVRRDKIAIEPVGRNGRVFRVFHQSPAQTIKTARRSARPLSLQLYPPTIAPPPTQAKANRDITGEYKAIAECTGSLRVSSCLRMRTRRHIHWQTAQAASALRWPARNGQRAQATWSAARRRTCSASMASAPPSAASASSSLCVDLCCPWWEFLRFGSIGFNVLENV